MAASSRSDAAEARKPDSPADVRKPSWLYTARRAAAEFGSDECTDLAAALTYYAVLSIFPAIIALVSILGLVGQSGDTLTGIAEDTLPASAMETAGPVLEGLTSTPAPGLGLILGLLTAVWTASNYVNAFSRAMNRIYEVEEGRPVWKLRPVIYLLTIVMLVLVALAVVILAVSGPVAQAIGDAVGLGDAAVTVWSIAKWPVLLLLVVVIIALLYHGTPNVKQPKLRWISVGAIVAIVVAVLASVGFALYVVNAGSYDATYGALAGVIVFLLWLWIINVALLFGAEFDAELERSRELQAGIAAEEQIQLPARDTRASDKKAAKKEKVVARGRALRRTRGESQDVEDDPKTTSGSSG